MINHFEMNYDIAYLNSRIKYLKKMIDEIDLPFCCIDENSERGVMLKIFENELHTLEDILEIKSK